MEPERTPRARTVLARHLRWRRFVLGWSQEELAAASGMHRTYISTLERARCNPGLDALERLAQALQVPVASLLDPAAPDPSGSLAGPD